ncbi:alpha/beta fold hydrolase [Glacieibacterium frigidum]|uniref:Alpha/beta hydrolase n=1 Tax=Glacieibacterium frigidum TaxID=2593303 RepID=A0A552UAJ9_9SPHN|nr:alpha/beta hydrolase [Glacieibacterium frigidum]TRW15237.1 alpha/beta hydrolase [Glacieibacterium frigidum]
MVTRSVRAGHGVLEWLGDPARPWLHFAHATGMCAEVYARLLDPLAREFNIVASDARGHGRSTLPADPAAMTSWRVYQDDLAALLATYDAPAWLLAGHSMGASVSIELAARRPELATAVVLVEPAFVPFDGVAPWQDGGIANPLAEQAARRRDRFASVDEARAQWHGRGVFRGWDDADLDAYLAGGLRPDGDGVMLACAPAWEAATFAAVTSAVEAAVRAWQGPLALLHGTRFSTVSQADADTVAALGGAVTRVDGASHFLPLEHPDAVRAAIRAAAAGTVAAAHR